MKMNCLHAFLKALGVVFFPIPYTGNPLLADAACEPREGRCPRTPARNPSNRAGMQEVHRVNDEGNVGGVLALGVGELLLRNYREPFELLLPAAQARAGEVSVNPAHARFSERCDLSENGFAPFR